MSKGLPKNVAEWSNQEVLMWLMEAGHSRVVPQFQAHDIDGKALLTLREDDLKGPGMNLGKIGDVKRVYISIKKLQKENVSVLFDLGQLEFFSSGNFFSQQRHEVI